MLVSGRSIGVKITMYRSGEVVGGSMTRRQVESEWDIYRERLRVSGINGPDTVGLMFKGAVPPRKQLAAFMEEIVAFVGDHTAELTARDNTYWHDQFSTH
jgi:hypothetical protein